MFLFGEANHNRPKVHPSLFLYCSALFGNDTFVALTVKKMSYDVFELGISPTIIPAYLSGHAHPFEHMA